MSGRPTAAQITRWADEVVAVGDRIGHHFARSEPRRRAVGYIRGLLSETEPGECNRWLLNRRSASDPSDVAYFACGGPPATTLDELVRVAGMRRSIEDLFELAKGDCGLDEYEVRGWVGWHRPVTLSLWARAVVAVIRSRRSTDGEEKGGAKVIALTVPEVRNLLLRLVWVQVREVDDVLAWSDGRR